MMSRRQAWALAVVLASGGTAWAQQGASTAAPPAVPLPDAFWAPKPTTPTPYIAPNRPWWKLANIEERHAGRADWVEPLMRNPDQEADYISLGPGRKTKPMFYSDDRFVFIVQRGSLRVTVQGREPFVATKGFMVNVPRRHVFTLETVGSEPSLRFEVRQTGAVPLYPAGEQPDPRSGSTYVRVTGSPEKTAEDPANPIFFDFLGAASAAGAGGKMPGVFVRDDHFTANIVRGEGRPVPPESDLGHFHVGVTEFWFIMEGKVGYKIEGMPYFEAGQGDVVAAAPGRWHRASNSPASAMSTRIPINPRPPVLHNFQAR